jgi:predicted ester cyclase
MSAEQNQVLARRFFAEQDIRKGALAPELCAPGYTAHIGSNPPMNREGHSQFGMMFYVGFPDIYHTIDETFADGDKVALRFTLRGTHKGSFLGAPPTDKAISVTANIILHFADGKVVELYGEFDSLGLMQQLGAIQSPA